MPRIAAGVGGRLEAHPTENEAALIRGMNHRGTLSMGIGGVRPAGSNIAALHFDGQALVDMVRTHREIEAAAGGRRFLIP